MATEPIPAGTVLLEVPARALLTIDSGESYDKSIKRHKTAHEILTEATGPTVETDRQPWYGTWPDFDSVNSSFPLMWDKQWQNLLPPTAKKIFDIQLLKYKSAVRGREQQLARGDKRQTEAYKYRWLLINSRCYFWPYAKSRQSAGNVDECMALVPFADYFNHSDSGSAFVTSPKGCTMTSDRDYRVGDEVIACYGTHSNDFLLVEYGFIMDKNEHDHLELDHIIESMLTAKQRQLLDDMGYLGKYGFYPHGTCFRTEIALAAMTLATTKTEQVAAGEGLSDWDQAKVDSKRDEVFLRYLDEVEDVLEDIDTGRYPGIPPCLEGRWRQMKALLRNTEDWKAMP